MENEVIFRKAGFGGFNREDVTNYIVEQKNKITELENSANELAEKTAKAESENNELKLCVADIKQKLADSEKEKSELIKKCSENDYELLYKQFEEKNFEVNAKNKIIEELQIKLNALSIENEKIKTELTQSSQKEVELQVGTAMLDVRKFADMVISDAEEKICEMEEKSQNAAVATQGRLNDITLGIRVFADKLNNIIADVIKDAEALNGNMDAFSQYFNEPKKALSSYDYRNNGDNDVK